MESICDSMNVIAKFCTVALIERGRCGVLQDARRIEAAGSRNISYKIHCRISIDQRNGGLRNAGGCAGRDYLKIKALPDAYGTDRNF